MAVQEKSVLYNPNIPLSSKGVILLTNELRSWVGPLVTFINDNACSRRNGSNGEVAG